MTPPLHYSSRLLDWQPFDPWGATKIPPTVHDSLVITDSWASDTAERYRVELCSAVVHVAGLRQMEGALYVQACRYDLDTAPETAWFLRKCCLDSEEHEHEANRGMVSFPATEEVARAFFAILRTEQLANMGVEVEGS